MQKVNQQIKVTKTTQQKSDLPMFAYELTAIAITAVVGVLIGIIFTFLV